MNLLWKEFWPSCHGYGGFARVLELENERPQDFFRRLRLSSRMPVRRASSVGQGRRWGTCKQWQPHVAPSENNLALVVALGAAVLAS